MTHRVRVGVLAATLGLFAGCMPIVTVSQGPDGGGSLQGSSSDTGGTAANSSQPDAGNGGSSATGGGGQGTGGVGGCLSASDCPGPDTECRRRACALGHCEFLFVAAGTPTVGGQVEGDCQRVVCNGKGGLLSVGDNEDVLDDDNPCTDDLCSEGAPSNVAAAAGTPCSAGTGKMCNGGGACVACLKSSDCEAGECLDQTCAPATCNDGAKNGLESDVDCGGGCPLCAEGLQCGAPDDCQSGICSDTPPRCQPSSCSDAVRNGGETDIDCGGPCDTKCDPGQGCLSDADCVGGQCSGSTCLQTCHDHLTNGSETDVDCGGALCAGCPPDKACAAGSDCESDVCKDAVCQAPACDDGARNGLETDTDCGGEHCSACATDQLCAVGSDCLSGVCVLDWCQAPACDDGVRNGLETDTDCGGLSCGPCVIGQTCAADTDCQKAVCVAGACTSLACGDGVLSNDEGCDDANAVDGDCCSSSCQIEAGCESEPNNDAASAETFAGDRVRGFIEPAGDVDIYEVVVPAGTLGTIVAATKDGFLGTTCASNTLDSYIFLYSADGAALAANDNNLTNRCSTASATSLPPGTYHIQVMASPNALPEAQRFEYTLHLALTLAVCGDGSLEPGERCDDGNLVDGDGCSSQCKVEASPAVEPNDSCATANGPYAIPTGPYGAVVSSSFTTVNSEDWYAFVVPAYADVTLETFDSSGPRSCSPGAVNMEMQVHDADCVARGPVRGQGGVNNCAKIDPASHAETRHLPPGTYVVRVFPFFSGSAAFGYTFQATFAALCGDGVVEGSEQCDGGAGCDLDCMLLPVCGDGVRQSGEQCDDANTADGDGCDSACQWESSDEAEPNDTCATANGPAGVLRTGNLNPPGSDQDYYAFTLSSYADLRLETFDGTGPGACASSVDTMIALYEPDCTTLVLSKDGGGIGNCAKIDPSVDAAARRLAPGTYYVRVEGNGSTAYDYVLQATVTAVCGDGVVEGSEQCDGGDGCGPDCALLPACGDGVRETGESCDDGDTQSGDGCSATCQWETVAEVEPNGTVAQAGAALAPITGDTNITGALNPTGDKDIFRLDVTGNTVVRFETFNSSGDDCTTMPATKLTLLNSTGTTLKTNKVGSGIGTCAALVVLLQTGTYHVQVTKNTTGTVAGYFLQVKFETAAGSEAEPNDALGQATLLPGQSRQIFGDHQGTTDVDWYEVAVPAGASIRAETIEGDTAETCESGGIDTNLYLLDASGDLLGSNGDSGRGMCSLINGTGATPTHAFAHNLLGGSYYLRVESFSTAAQSINQFNYRLVVDVR